MIKNKISVILPVYSEKEIVVYLVEKLIELLKNNLYEIIVIVSPQSCPETLQIVDKLSQSYSFVKNYMQIENPGLGRAVRQGLSIASGTLVLMMDSDGQMNPETIPLMLNKMELTGCDMVAASRWMRGGGVTGYNPIKYFLNRIFQYIFRIAFWTRLHDLTLGFKLMKKEIACLPWNSIFHEITVETTLRPLRKGYHIEEVPTLVTRRLSGGTKNCFRRNFRHVWKAFEILVKK